MLATTAIFQAIQQITSFCWLDQAEAMQRTRLHVIYASSSIFITTIISLEQRTGFGLRR